MFLKIQFLLIWIKPKRLLSKLFKSSCCLPPCYSSNFTPVCSQNKYCICRASRKPLFILHKNIINLTYIFISLIRFCLKLFVFYSRWVCFSNSVEPSPQWKSNVSLPIRKTWRSTKMRSRSLMKAPETPLLPIRSVCGARIRNIGVLIARKRLLQAAQTMP